LVSVVLAVSAPWFAVFISSIAVPATMHQKVKFSQQVVAKVFCFFIEIIKTGVI
jgi:hypothetical protein